MRLRKYKLGGPYWVDGCGARQIEIVPAIADDPAYLRVWSHHSGIFGWMVDRRTLRLLAHAILKAIGDET